MKFFAWRSCAHAEECSEETFTRVAQKICEGTSIWTDDCKNSSLKSSDHISLKYFFDFYISYRSGIFAD